MAVVGAFNPCFDKGLALTDPGAPTPSCESEFPVENYNFTLIAVPGGFIPVPIPLEVPILRPGLVMDKEPS